jgi:hypothetical protein
LSSEQQTDAVQRFKFNHPETTIMAGESRLPYGNVTDTSQAAQPGPMQVPQSLPPLPPRRPAAQPLPSRTPTSSPEAPTAVLPRRTARVRAGRHRSPDRLTVPLDAPLLVLAVPGAACPASEEIMTGVVASAQTSCPAAHIRVGYLEGTSQPLEEALAADPSADAGFGDDAPEQLAPAPGTPVVVVPLLAGPHPAIDAVLAGAAAAQAFPPVLVAGHLGPHPLLAEALHVRLAEAGLARSGRVRGLSIVSSANGVLVLAAGGAEAVQAAGIAAVMLASRLAVPALPAALEDPQGIASAAARLREAGTNRLAVAPCIVGPEARPGELEAAVATIGADSAQPLGSHSAVGQLAAIRYGDALSDQRLVSMLAGSA